MDKQPDLWADLLNGLRNSWPQISGSLLAVLICYGRLIYDGVARKKRWVEPLLCGALSWGVSSGLELFGIPGSVSPALGGTIGFIGVEKLREFALRAINKRLGDKSHD
ncbi:MULTISPECIES: phage holin, lambda family [Photorhabdus]|uniref:Phage holin, lambda family n=1 Tax=Photorhabdus heterorhabditis TaxID=880156 RepID=A0A5B0X7Z7_9GAMM|nr:MULTISPECIES: phage holin, lambda family [Photorhabdus]AXG45000.1 phage holin, lambda family [Photorhabdus laumondii subsp. laumondii]KAA1194728.1 phage holin, lambda family [Photorhabdus heterorhabditis]NDL17694.1 phage holin, lambda family [Photorhabdus laumondii subsp. laumondii]NDL49443.1 phage holin, lambda family [Photorhabdus laumondii subsp. laumondii]NDL54037.1 phage holin, lambda family [Photorhabdus laumondii subsp. laumondii]